MTGELPPITPGLRVYDQRGQVKVMAVVDGWAMCRRSRCIPFTVHVKNFWDTYSLQPLEATP